MIVSGIVIYVFRTHRRVAFPLNLGWRCVAYKVPPYIARKPVVIPAITYRHEGVMKPAIMTHLMRQYFVLVVPRVSTVKPKNI